MGIFEFSGSTVAWWSTLLPHSKKMLCSNPPCDQDLAVYSLHALHMSAWCHTLHYLIQPSLYYSEYSFVFLVLISHLCIQIHPVPLSLYVSLPYQYGVCEKASRLFQISHALVTSAHEKRKTSLSEKGIKIQAGDDPVQLVSGDEETA